MCGICGYLTPDSDGVDESALTRMMRAMKHRGPDDEGVWRHGGVGLGHVRLSIIDTTQRGHQPFVTQDGQGVLAYNGEVYNFRALRNDLEHEGVTFLSETDTEVVLYALHVWGPAKAISKMNGMFAFAYYDRRRDELWLVRDRLGIKPLHYAVVGQTHVFASEMKSLLTFPGVPTEPDHLALASYVVSAVPFEDHSAFKAVRAVPPGCFWRITPTSTEKYRFFDPLENLDRSRLEASLAEPASEFPARFESRFKTSVGLHMISDVPLAAMCSGGLDSSLVTSVAASFNKDLEAYVADVQVTDPEGDKAQVVTDYLNVKLHRIHYDDRDCLRMWPDAVWYNDQPNHHPHDMAFLKVVRQCREDGVKVLLTGEGADELFGGYEQQEAAYRFWRRLRLRHKWTPNVWPFRKLARLHPSMFPLNIDTRRQYPFMYRWDRSAVKEWLLQSCALDGDQQSLFASLFTALDGVGKLEDQAFIARSLSHLYGHLLSLLHRNDRMGMAASVETRVPFIENGLIELGMHMPRHAKFHRGVEKWSMKQMARRWLPPQTVQARKRGFSFNPHTFAKVLPIIQNGFVPDLFRWSDRAQRFLLDQLPRSSYPAAYRIISLELWGRMYLAGEQPQALGEQLVRLAA